MKKNQYKILVTGVAGFLGSHLSEELSNLGHKIIASYIADFSDIDKVIFIVSPASPFKKQIDLLDKNHRLKIVKMSIEDNSKLQASDIEFSMPEPSYTIDTLLKIKSKNAENDYVIIMGADNLKDFYKWKNHKQILDNNTIYVFPRPGFEVRKKHKNIKIFTKWVAVRPKWTSPIPKSVFFRD